MKIARFHDNLEKYLIPGKALILYGPRRVGKTTLLRDMLDRSSLKYKLDSGDNIRIQELLSSRDFALINDYLSGYDLIAIDEAQQIPDIGMALKIIVDQHPGVRVIATGSSSFELSNNIGEPLTGRKTTLTLYPFAQIELLKHFNRHELREKLEDLLIFGSYPDVFTAGTREEKILALNELVDSYLFKDVLSLEQVKKSRVIVGLVKLLAFQIGGEVSLSELGQQLGADTKTIGRYLDLLEKSFVIYSLAGFSRNLRSEITSKQKYYFYDNGIRNAIIGQFNTISNRNDTGPLWENFLMAERLKYRSYLNMYGDFRFWRTYEQQEIDLIEDSDGQLYAYEFKWSEKKTAKAPLQWQKAYPQAKWQVVTPQNYLDFIGK